MLKKSISFIIVGILILGGIGTVAVSNPTTAVSKTLQTSIQFSKPTVEEKECYSHIQLTEATSSLMRPGEPKLPVVTRVFTFPFGTRINKVTCTNSVVHEWILDKPIIPTPPPMPISTVPSAETVGNPMQNTAVYSQVQAYPGDWYSYRVGSGLDGDRHVVFLTVYCYPIQYHPLQNKISYTDRVTIEITYEPPRNPIVFADDNDLVIISPDEFTSELQQLVDHKNNVGVATSLMTTEDIYSIYPGRDEAEQIKYYIKDAIETQGVAYVLLIGSVYRLPMRESYVSLWHFEDNVITDLYYADIYDDQGQFCSWDSNGNDKFGEQGQDKVDLYPDVHIGRLACENNEEVMVVVDKILHYETETYGQPWFHDMIFIGGDTFPRWGGNEGEELNEIIMGIMSDFSPSSIIWTSKKNFNRRTISGAINEGAGFLDYSGHGFEHGMGTYPPDGRYLRTYLTPHLKDLVNGYELPIIFFDACLTAKLDFILKDVLSYKQYWIFYLFALLLHVDTSMKLPVYAWCFVRQENGGAIATIGATRTAYGGVESGAGKMSIEFFQAYASCPLLGQMMTQAQNAYITDVPDDAFTVEEFMLIGDPSLKVGGYP
jgi:hypothetical protein